MTDEAAQRAGRQRVRLVDVAAASGVTKSVASRVLNADPTLNVRPKTRDRILAAARELGYQPHAGARALAGAESRALALLIPDLTNPVYSRIIRGAYQQAHRHGYVLLLAEDTANQQADESFTELVETGRVDGLLIASARPAHPLIDSPRLARVPHVFVNREVPGSGRNVGMDLAAASATAVRYLHGLGHRAIGMVSGPSELEPARARTAGYVAEMSRVGLDPSALAHGAFSEQGGAEAATELLTSNPGLTAIYASTLGQAVGVLHAARAQGRRMPEDLSVIAYDDLPLADYLAPPLTTIAMPLLELGAAAVTAVLAQLSGQPPQDIRVNTVPTVIERSSSRPPRSTERTTPNSSGGGRPPESRPSRHSEAGSKVAPS